MIIAASINAGGWFLLIYLPLAGFFIGYQVGWGGR